MEDVLPLLRLWLARIQEPVHLRVRVGSSRLVRTRDISPTYEYEHYEASPNMRTRTMQGSLRANDLHVFPSPLTDLALKLVAQEFRRGVLQTLELRADRLQVRGFFGYVLPVSEFDRVAQPQGLAAVVLAVRGRGTGLTGCPSHGTTVMTS